MRLVIAFLSDDFGGIHADYFMVGAAVLLAIVASINAVAHILH